MHTTVEDTPLHLVTELLTDTFHNVKIRLRRGRVGELVEIRLALVAQLTDSRVERDATEELQSELLAKRLCAACMLASEGQIPLSWTYL